MIFASPSLALAASQDDTIVFSVTYFDSWAVLIASLGVVVGLLILQSLR